MLTDQLTALQPLAATMAASLQNAGVTPPTNLQALSEAFHQQIVQPASTYIKSGNLVKDITGYVANQINNKLSGQTLSPNQNVVATNGLAAVQNQQKPFYQNPFFIVGVLVVVAFAIYWFKFRK